MSSEILLRKTIRLILESQGATTVRVDPAGVSPGFRPFGIVSGLAIDTGMTVLQSLDPSIVGAWASATCLLDNNWPFKETSAALNTGNAVKYADLLAIDVRDNAMGVITACVQLAQSIARGSTLAATSTFKPAAQFTAPATASSQSSRAIHTIQTGTDGIKFMSGIYSRLSTDPNSCTFDKHVSSTFGSASRDNAIRFIKMVAQAAFQGGQSQLDQHVSKFMEPAFASAYATIDVNNKLTPPVTYITTYKKTFVAESQRFISLIK